MIKNLMKFTLFSKTNQIFWFYTFTKNHKITKNDFWKNQKNVKFNFDFFRRKHKIASKFAHFHTFFIYKRTLAYRGSPLKSNWIMMTRRFQVFRLVVTLVVSIIYFFRGTVFNVQPRDIMTFLYDFVCADVKKAKKI